MRTPRIYTEQTLLCGQTVELEQQASHHLSKVLRLQVGAPLILFNGQGGHVTGFITAIHKKYVTANIDAAYSDDKQSPLDIHLGIAMSKGERMDWVVQKATELGISSLTPLMTERTEVKLKADREQKKIQHWQQVIISACEQSGRNRLTQLHKPAPLHSWLTNTTADKKLVLHHRTEQRLLRGDKPTSVALLIGPEGGLSSLEIQQAEQQGFQALCLGPRVLRTETAPMAAVSILQFLWGDF